MTTGPLQTAAMADAINLDPAGGALGGAQRELRELPIFSETGDHELAGIASRVDEIEVLPGEALVKEGDPGEQSFIIVSGEAEVSIGGSSIATLGPGEFFGEMAILQGKPRAATVTAKTDMRLVVIAGEDFYWFLKQPGIAVYMLREIVARLRTTHATAVSHESIKE